MNKFKKKIIYGFTLLEILAVIAIIVTLIGIGIPAYESWRNRAQIERARAVISQIEMALEMYKTENGAYPNWGEELNNPVTPSQWKITNCLANYMKFSGMDIRSGVIYDPWGHYYVVLADHDGNPSTPGYPNYWRNRNACYIYSYGPNERESFDAYDASDNLDNIDNFKR